MRSANNTRITCLALVVALAFLAGPVSGQFINDAERTRTALNQPPPIATEIKPFFFEEPLPTDPVAWVDGKAVTADALLRVILKNHLQLVVAALASNEKLAMELAYRKLQVSEEMVNKEFTAMMKKMDPQGSGKALVGPNSMKHLRKQAWAQAGWKLLYWDQFKIPEEQRHTEMNPMILSIVRKQIEVNFEMRMRGQAQGPRKKGVIVEIKHLPSGQEASVGANQALDFLMGLVKQGSLINALDDLIDTYLVDRALETAGVAVAAEEVAQYSAAEDAKFANSIIPRAAILRQQGLTPDQDNERWRRVQAWRRVITASGTAEEKKLLPTSETLAAFLEENRAFFMNEHKKVSHILLRTIDELTSLPFPIEKQEEAKKLAELVYEKAIEGVDFAALARNYSDDSTTARGDGRMSVAIKSRGGSLDPAFRDAAWALERIGDISKPVRTRFGWHILKLDDHQKPARTLPDFTRGMHLDWLRTEYETEMMQEWVARLREGAEIKKVSQEQLFVLKSRGYWSGMDKTPEAPTTRPEKDK